VSLTTRSGAARWGKKGKKKGGKDSDEESIYEYVSTSTSIPSIIPTSSKENNNVLISETIRCLGR